MTAILCVAVMFPIWEFARRNEIPIPDEKAAAMELLERKLSGPRYFNLPVSGNTDSNGPWISIEDARSQMDRVILQRHLGGSQRKELEQLMSQLSEPNPARMVGGCRIPLERLNLALDAIKN